MILGYLKRLDWVLVGLMLGIVAIGLLTMVSSSHGLFVRQLVWLGIGLCAFMSASLLDWRMIVNRGIVLWSIYGCVVALLVATLFFAPEVRGTKGWLEIFGFTLQASELSKISLILVFAAFFARHHLSIGSPRTILASLLYLFPIVFLIMGQPDLGSTLIVCGLWIAFLLMSEIPRRLLITLFIIFSIIASLGWIYGLQEYQKERILGFLYPETRTLGINYHVTQSKIAIGSAGFFGKGFGQGSQVHLGFLPDALTDFISAAFIEEWGLLGGILLLTLFIVLFFRVLMIGLRAHENVSRFICLGVASALVLHAIINIGSVVGLLPVIGVPFPLLSYGGSSLLTFMILLGIVSSIARDSETRVL